ncbi:MAG: bifunctional UDP-N-acetylglucosamine diphosphorylase/glucosamine-1-phosphate N-acetyltransferase GlmU [Firmicutes bacterium]|jgi:bifunctional UDP-N-acetylglucosamine pyrophosphorylase/glucosamine-1-phosphate N-acetyltransferase|nr:bifunctional UDP-N-acetylglucosamine diphosphorylase/glucosamine-1-phosphate N-acetyltransferase GlmU [Bacillota bacterium]MDD4791774.1 bifunctional UDP-N-acetylglucosamine diphosphorylase/glucosamine-1-phosphate N-acetyltransferase GlmU [Bacillota bacterium]
MASFVGLVLAAGHGKRMKSTLPKVLHQVAGIPMIDHVVGVLVRSGASRTVVVVGYGGEVVEEHLAGRADVVWQKEQLGTGHAVLSAGPAFHGYDGNIVVMPGDVPLVTPETIEELVDNHANSENGATILTMHVEDPTGYGRIVRDSQGNVAAIIEHRDATEEIRAVREVNTGVFCFDKKKLFDALPCLSSQNEQGEYYLTDVIKVMISQGLSVGAVALQDASDGLGINSRVQLSEAELIMRNRKRGEMMECGVTMIDPSTTFIDANVEIGPDTIIMPFTVIAGNSKIGGSCNIGPYVYICDSEVGNECNIGPFSYLRPGTSLSDHVKVGDFVEIKKSSVGEGSKIPHLSYIGDTVMGSHVNIGAGTITCNYDGTTKNTTIIEDGAFVGANSNLVAPVKVGRDAYIATGSTVTSDVPQGALAIGRARQENKEGWVARSRAAQSSKEEK